MTDRELADQAAAALKQTTVSYPTWAKNVAAGKYPDPKQTKWGQAFNALNQIGTTTPPPPPPPVTGRPFAADSIWNTPIAANPALRPESAAVMAYMATRWTYPNLPLRGWGMPIYTTKPGDPTYTITTMYQGNLNTQGPVPIPNEAAPDPESDGHMIIIDPNRNLTWGMWTAKKTATGWTAGGGEVVTLTGPGLLVEGQLGSNAAGFPLLAGVIRPEEILAGHIDHALTFNLPGVNKTGHVWPAVHNDGTSTDPNAPKEGMRFQLDPAFDVNTLSGYTKVVAKALQQYGAFLRDEGGTVSFGSETTSRWTTVPGIPTSEVAPLNGIPWTRMRVIA